MTWTYSDEYYKEYTRDTWNESAAHYVPLMHNLARYDPPLLRLARPGPGAHVLDVATGPGEPALTIARMVAPDGRVTGVDLAERMIEIANERAKGHALANVSFQVDDAEALSFEDASFDLVVNRFGLQIFTDPDKALDETFRVLRPGGRFATSVWASPGERVPHIHTIIGPMLEHAEPDETGYLPTPYEMGGTGELVKALEAHGFADVETVEASYDFVFENKDAFKRAILDGTPIGHSLHEEDEAVQQEVLAKWEVNLEPYLFGGAVIVPGEAVYATGVKPA